MGSSYDRERRRDGDSRTRRALQRMRHTLVIALGYGVFRHSRVAAVMLLLLLAAGAIERWVTTGQRGTNTLLAIFGYFYVQGIRGTLDYARLLRERVVT